MRNIFLFDVEAASLYGEGFAVGAIVCNNGKVLDTFSLMSTDVAANASTWVVENVLKSLVDMPKCKSGKQLRQAFFNFYRKHQDTCDIWSDVNFPVETNFLISIVKDNENDREFSMPYPLYDIANFVDVSIDRSISCGLMLRKHNPLDDCIASYYTLIKSEGFKQFNKK